MSDTTAQPRHLIAGRRSILALAGLATGRVGRPGASWSSRQANPFDFNGCAAQEAALPRKTPTFEMEDAGFGPELRFHRIWTLVCPG